MSGLGLKEDEMERLLAQGCDHGLVCKYRLLLLECDGD